MVKFKFKSLATGFSWSLALLIILAIGTNAIQRKQEKLNQAPVYGERPVPIEIAVAKSGTYRQTHDYLAIVEPEESASISAQITAAIQEIEVDEGDTVNQGDLLIRLDSREIEASIESLSNQIKQTQSELKAQIEQTRSIEHSLEFWRKELKRYRTLADQGSVPIQKVDETEDKTQSLQSEFESSKHKEAALRHTIDSLISKQNEWCVRLSYTVLASPFQGVVTERFCDPGELAQPGKVLLRIDGQFQLRLAFDVPQSDIPMVQVGLPIHFTMAEGSRTVVISKMFPTFNEARMVRAEAILPPELTGRLQIGAYVPVRVTVQEVENAVLVPRGSIVPRKDGGSYVFLVEQDRLKAIPVEVIGHQGTESAVTGIDPGDQIAVSTFMGWSALSSGLKVEGMP